MNNLKLSFKARVVAETARIKFLTKERLCMKRTKRAKDDKYQSRMIELQEVHNLARWDARAMNLAYAIVRGVSYKKVERTTNMSAWQRNHLLNLVSKITLLTPQKIAEWMNVTQ